MGTAVPRLSNLSSVLAHSTEKQRATFAPFARKTESRERTGLRSQGSKGWRWDLNSGFASTMSPRYRGLRGEIQREAESGQGGRGQAFSPCPQLLLHPGLTAHWGGACVPGKVLSWGRGPTRTFGVLERQRHR